MDATINFEEEVYKALIQKVGASAVGEQIYPLPWCEGKLHWPLLMFGSYNWLAEFPAMREEILHNLTKHQVLSQPKIS